MTFTKSDLLTFGIGLGVAIAIALGEALIRLDSDPAQDVSIWARNLLTGLGAAAGRYVATRLPEWKAKRK